MATSSRDVVAVLASDFTQVFADARALKIAVNPSSKLMEHPVETGATIVDHRVLLPVTAELSVIISTANYKAVYQQIRDLFARGELLTVQTHVESFPNMVIEKIPHDESGDIIDGVAVSIALKQAQFVTAQFASLPPQKVARPKDADTVQRGQQQPTPSPERKGSILSGAFK